ncbi:hypothetical protein DFJ74DRAFT_674897 [Hyaloraphidium curvatum]|nr:hypothetical protein DFJ74DRAFT_674897 [Hyaloraphidium curvatum]
MRESFGIMFLNDLTAMFLKFDLFTWCVWTVYTNYLDFHIHCGYKFPWNPINLIEDPLVHDFHHYRNVGNFATTHWDILFGTNKHYVQWQKRQAERKAKGLEEEAERRTDPDEDGDAAEKLE